MTTDLDPNLQMTHSDVPETAATAFNVFPPEAPPPPGASEELIEYIQFWRQSEREDFASNLETARLVYALRPDLVTAPHWPADVKAAFRAYGNDYDPDVETSLSIGERAFDSDYEEWVLSQAEKSMREAEAKRLEEARNCKIVRIDHRPVDAAASPSAQPELSDYDRLSEALRLIAKAIAEDRQRIARIEQKLARKTGGTKKRRTR
jgi:hypothetical protein